MVLERKNTAEVCQRGVISPVEDRTEAGQIFEGYFHSDNDAQLHDEVGQRNCQRYLRGNVTDSMCVARMAEVW